MNNSLNILFLIPFSLAFSTTFHLNPEDRSYIDLRNEICKSQQEFLFYNVSPLTLSEFYSYSEFRDLKQVMDISNKNIILGSYPEINFNSQNYTKISSILQFNINNNLTLINSMKLDNRLNSDSLYIGKTWRGFTGYTELGYLNYRRKVGKDKLDISFGRFFDYWGPGRTGQLIMSHRPQPLDQIRIIYNHNAVTLISKFAKLDNFEIFTQRYLSAHRLTIENSNLSLSMSEVVLYGGLNKELELSYINPFIIYHGVQNNNPAIGGNTIWSVDAQIQLNNLSGYVELIIDDIQVDKNSKKDLEPNEYGLLIGVDKSFPKMYSGIELVLLTNRTYKTRNEFEWYLYRNQSIGYKDGSDLWRVNFFNRYYYSKKWQFDFELDYLVKGEGEMSVPWDEPWMDDDITMDSGYHESFPTGILETTTTSSLGLFRVFGYNKWVQLEIKYVNIKNKNHGFGNRYYDFELNIGFAWLFTTNFDLN